MNEEQVIKEIIRICCEIGVDNISLMLAFAEAESTMGQANGIYDNIDTAKSPKGVFQIAESYIIEYNSKTLKTEKGSRQIDNSFIMTLPLRANLRSSIICVYETNIFYKAHWKSNIGKEIENYQLYIAHKQTVWGAKELWNDRDAEIRKYNDKYNILGNVKKEWNLTLDSKVSEYFECWEKDINEKVEKYKDRNCKELETEPPFPSLEKNKPEIPDWQQQDNTRVKPPTLLEQIKLQQDQMKAIEQQVGNIAPASDLNFKSPGPNYKSNRPINNTKFNVDKQLIPVG
jgi:hypothetical protein